jgi:hypothetical protein
MSNLTGLRPNGNDDVALVAVSRHSSTHWSQMKAFGLAIISAH